MTLRRQIQDALQEREGFLEAIVTASPLGLVLSTNKILEWVNPAAGSILGCAAEEDSLIGKNLKALFADRDEFKRVERFLAARPGQESVGKIEAKLLTRAGTEIHCQLQASPLSDADPGQRFVLGILDITALKQTWLFQHDRADPLCDQDRPD